MYEGDAHWQGYRNQCGFIKLWPAKWILWEHYLKHPDAFRDNFHFETFVQRYASEHSLAGNPFVHARELQPGDAEWQRALRLTEGRAPNAFIVLSARCAAERLVQGAFN